METPIENKSKSIEEHLLTRELVDFDVLTAMLMADKTPDGKAEITLNQEVLDKVSDAWETHKDAITAVVSARVKQLLIQVAINDIPQEVTVTRQAIKENLAILDDFETLHTESVRRKQVEKEN